MCATILLCTFGGYFKKRESGGWELVGRIRQSCKMKVCNHRNEKLGKKKDLKVYIT